MAIIDANINPPKMFEKEVSVKSNKGATAILVGLLAFIAYLYLSGKLTAIGRAISGAPDPLGAATGGGTQPLQVVPIVGAPTGTAGTIPINPAGQKQPGPDIPAPPVEPFTVSVKHRLTGTRVTLKGDTFYTCTTEIAAQLVGLAGFTFVEAVPLADRICADAKQRSAQRHKPGASNTFPTVVP